MRKVRSKKTHEEKKLLGVKIRRKVIDELKEYADLVDQPINYCAEKLMQYGLSHQYDFQRRRLTGSQNSQDFQKGWDAFLEMGKRAVRGKSKDASVLHDRYLYGVTGKK